MTSEDLTSANAVEKIFGRLGDRVEHEWQREFYDPRAFPRIAERALLEDPPHRGVTSIDVMRWALTANRLGPQPNAGSDFGRPAITLYSARRFYIEALFWLDGSMNVHDHGFDGAFSVLEGSSVHSRYEFRETRRISSRLLFGDVEHRESDLLTAGSVQTITSGRDYIHSLFHLERPSVSIVVRTYQTLQYSYRPPFVAMNSVSLDAWTTRAVDYVHVALETKPREAIDIVRTAMRQADDIGVYRVLNDIFVWAAGDRPDAEGSDSGAGGANDFAARVRGAAVEVARARLGEGADLMVTSIEEDMRRTGIKALRSELQDPAHRFFLALLLNVPDRAQLLQLVKKAHPESDPVDKVCEWLGALSGEENPLLGYSFSPDILSLIRCLIEGTSSEGCLVALGRARGFDLAAGEVEAVRGALGGLRRIDILRSLLGVEGR